MRNRTFAYSWIIPVYNEAPSVPDLLRQIKQAMRGINYEIVIVDDGSTDQLQTQNPKCKVIRIPHSGKWLSLREGFRQSRGKIIITCDGDLQDDPQEGVKLAKALTQSRLDIASGWRRNRQEDLYKIVLSRLGNEFLGFKDINSPLKIYKRAVMQQLLQQTTSWRFVLITAKRQGFKIQEIPINHRKRLYGTSKFGIVKYFGILYDLVGVLWKK